MRLRRFSDRRGGTERGTEGTGETTAGGGSASPDDSAEEAAGGEDQVADTPEVPAVDEAPSSDSGEAASDATPLDSAAPLDSDAPADSDTHSGSGPSPESETPLDSDDSTNSGESTRRYSPARSNWSWRRWAAAGLGLAVAVAGIAVLSVYIYSIFDDDGRGHDGHDQNWKSDGWFEAAPGAWSSHGDLHGERWKSDGGPGWHSKRGPGPDGGGKRAGWGRKAADGEWASSKRADSGKWADCAAAVRASCHPAPGRKWAGWGKWADWGHSSSGHKWADSKQPPGGEWEDWGGTGEGLGWGPPDTPGEGHADGTPREGLTGEGCTVTSIPGGGWIELCFGHGGDRGWTPFEGRDRGEWAVPGSPERGRFLGRGPGAGHWLDRVRPDGWPSPYEGDPSGVPGDAPFEFSMGVPEELLPWILEMLSDPESLPEILEGLGGLFGPGGPLEDLFGPGGPLAGLPDLDVDGGDLGGLFGPGGPSEDLFGPGGPLEDLFGPDGPLAGLLDGIDPEDLFGDTNSTDKSVPARTAA